MRVVFLGTPAAAVTALESLLEAGHEVALAITRPDRPVGRSGTPRPSPVKVAALSRGIPVLEPERVRTEELRLAIAAARPDVLAVVAYGRILTPGILSVAPHGAINAHFSLLPKYRGAAPVQWALARGERETGVTTFRLDDGLDTGDVLLQRIVPIASGEHAPSLLDRLASLGGTLLAETLTGLSAGSIAAHPQDPAAATSAPPLTRADGAFDPAWSAGELEGRVRGFDPWPGVWARCRGHRIRIVRAEARDGGPMGAPWGTILALEGDALSLACAGGSTASLLAVQPEGGRMMTAREAVNGRRLAPGDRLERAESTT